MTLTAVASGWFTSSGGSLGLVAAKAALIYATALLGLRVSERRTLAQWTLIDFAAAVAVGAIVGRTATADSQSYATGAVALVSILLMHRLATLLRYSPLLGKLVDHRVRVLVVDGQVRTRQLRVCGLTRNDLFAELRQRGVLDLSEVRFALYETKGGLSVVRAHGGPVPELVVDALRTATEYPDEGDR